MDSPFIRSARRIGATATERTVADSSVGVPRLKEGWAQRTTIRQTAREET